MVSIAVPEALLVTAPADSPLNGDTGAQPPANQTQQPAFITTQTLATFSGASIGVTALWKVVAAVAGTWADERWVPLVLSGLIGIWLVLKAFENADGPADYFGAVLVGAVNTAQLWAAVVGLDVVLDPTGIDQTGGGT